MHSFLLGREVHVCVWTHLVMISVFSKFYDAKRAMHRVQMGCIDMVRLRVFLRRCVS